MVGQFPEQGLHQLTNLNNDDSPVHRKTSLYENP